MPDHSKQIASMRQRAQEYGELEPTHDNRHVVENLRCAMALLECHDATGISLDDWQPVRAFVERYAGPIQENWV